MMEIFSSLVVLIGIPLQLAAFGYSLVLASRRRFQDAAYYLVLTVYILLLTRDFA